MTTSNAIWTAGEVLFTCTKCLHPVVNTYAQPANTVIGNHNKYCSPKRKSARQIAAEKAYDAREARGVSRPLARQTFTGRMFLASMEKLSDERRRQAREDARAVDAMANEGGRP